MRVDMCVWKRRCTVYNSSRKILAEGEWKECRLYMGKEDNPSRIWSTFPCCPSLLTWHKQLGHLRYNAMIDMPNLA